MVPPHICIYIYTWKPKPSVFKWMEMDLTIIFHGKICFIIQCPIETTIPIGSMYSMFTYIWLKFMVNVGKYTIHVVGLGVPGRLIFMMTNLPVKVCHLGHPLAEARTSTYRCVTATGLISGLAMGWWIEGTVLFFACFFKMAKEDPRTPKNYELSW